MVQNSGFIYSNPFTEDSPMPATRLNSRKTNNGEQNGHGLPSRSLQSRVEMARSQLFTPLNMIAKRVEGSVGQTHHVICQPETAGSL